jgi:phasin family protein
MSDVKSSIPKTDTNTKSGPVSKPEAIVAKATDRVAETVKQTADAAAEGIKTMQERARGGVQRVSEYARGYAEVQREALETGAHAARIYGEGLQGLAQHAAEISRVQFEESMAHLRSLVGVRSLTDLFSLQADFARKTASRALEETSTFAEGYLKVANDALAPVTARVREAAEKVKHAA